MQPRVLISAFFNDQPREDYSEFSLTEDALKDDTELRKNVKRVLEVIIGLLKDRAVSSEKLTTKKRRVEEIIKKKQLYRTLA